MVVIGILIAISLRNWNENKKERIKEKKILENILLEIESNDTILAAAKKQIEKETAHTDIIISLMKKDPDESSVLAIDSLLFYGTEVAKVKLHLVKIKSLIANDIELISNDSLKQQIILYPVLFEQYKVMEQTLRRITDERIRPRIKEYVYLNGLVMGSENFSSNRLALLSDRTLANDFIDRRWESAEWINDLILLKDKGQKLILTIEKNLQEK